MNLDGVIDTQKNNPRVLNGRYIDFKYDSTKHKAITTQQTYWEQNKMRNSSGRYTKTNYEYLNVDKSLK